MEMKDKIYRTNHKKGYYYLKKIGLYTSIAIGVSVLFAIPVSIVKSLVRVEPMSETISNPTLEDKEVGTLEF